MNFVSKYKRWLVMLAFSVVLVGCETNSAIPNGESGAWQPVVGTDISGFTPRHYDLIATDIVSGLIQVQELNPLTTTIQFSTPRGEFGKNLVEKLTVAGYGLQEVEGDRGAMYIAYQTRVINSNSKSISDFVVDVGGIEVRREYRLDKRNVVPSSLMYISGSLGLGNIILNENIFLQQDGDMEFESGVELELPDSTIVVAQTRDVGAGSQLKAVGSENAIRDARNNLMGRSNDEILSNRSQYRDVQRALITFQDSTLNVGLQNKAILKQVLTNFDQSTDAMFITTCSGDTGSQQQAVERSARIKEELVLNSVPVDLIVEDGCVVREYPRQIIEPRQSVLMHRRLDAGRAVASARPASNYPTKPLAMTIPYGAGGATDYQARIVTMVASGPEYLNEPILIVNKPGQGGRAGWSWFANNATNSGYDIASYNVPHFIAQSIKFGTPYNIDTLEPVANWGADPAVLVVPRDSPFRTVAELVRYARANEGELTVSGAGEYVGHHIALLQLEKAAGIKTNYISDRGGAAALKLVIDGEVQAGFNNMSDAYRLRSELRILAIADINRHPVIPAVSTFKELGLDIDDSSVNFRGLMVPKGTPPEIIEKLTEVALKMFSADVVVDRMREGGAPLRVMGREEVISMWNERQAYLTDLLRGL